MKKLITNLKVLMTLLLLCGVSSAWAVEKTLVIDGKPLTATATTDETVQNYGGFNIAFSKGAKYQNSKDATNSFSENASILIGKSGAYIYNKTPIPGKITKFEIYANAGASKKVSIGVNFSATVISAYNKDAGNTYTATLSTLNTVYDCSEKLAEGTQYFWYQVTNDNNSQVQFRITYDDGTAEDAPSIEASNLTIEADETSGSISYSITNPVAGKSLTASTTEDWITIGAITDNAIEFTTTKNESSSVRTGSITLKYDGAIDKVVLLTQNKPIPVYSSLAELIAAGEPTSTGETVTVTLTNEPITGFYTTSKGYVNGVFLDVDGTEIEIYCYDVPSTWVEGAYISGVLTCTWKKFNSTWELCPSSWNELTYSLLEAKTVAIGSTGYATYSSENYTIVPDPESGVQLFGAKINDEGTAVTLIPAPEGQTIGLKGAGYIVKATPNTIAFIEQTGENGNDIEGNQLVGTEQSERTLTQGEAYLLSATSDGTPFFGLCNEGTLAPFKAFLPVPAPGVKAILAIEEGGTTSISTIKNAELNVQDAIYNLAGQKVDADYKGIVIRNGKKMLNK